MIDQKLAPYAAFLLRVAMGVMFLAHASLKIFVFTMPGAAKFFASLGLPDWFAYVVTLMEVGGGLALILGVYARFVAIPLAIELLATIVLVHNSGWLFSSKGGGWEFPAFWAVGLVAVALMGEGAFALKSSLGGSKSSDA